MRPWSPLRSTSGTSHPRNVGRPGELRLLEQPAVAEALGDRAGVVAHHAGHEPGDGLDDEARGHLAAGEHDVADAQLVVDEVLGGCGGRRPRSARTAG